MLDLTLCPSCRKVRSVYAQYSRKESVPKFENVGRVLFPTFGSDSLSVHERLCFTEAVVSF